MRGPARILVIEDNGTNRALMVYLLKTAGYRTLEAVDGESGLELARRERPELVVCDVHLPKLDGFGVAQQLKSDEATSKIPIVAVTGLAMAGQRDRFLSAAFEGCIDKPIVPDTFIREIEKFLSATEKPKIVRQVPFPPLTGSNATLPPDTGGSEA